MNQNPQVFDNSLNLNFIRIVARLSSIVYTIRFAVFYIHHHIFNFMVDFIRLSDDIVNISFVVMF